MPRRVLVIVPAALPPAAARDRLSALFGDVEVEAKVVSPAVRLVRARPGPA